MKTPYRFAFLTCFSVACTGVVTEEPILPPVDAGAEDTGAVAPDSSPNRDAAGNGSAESSSNGDAAHDGSPVSTSNDSGVGRVPLNHRPSDAQCSDARPPGSCTASALITPGGCLLDSDCAAGVNGRCLNPGGGPAADCYCSYQECMHDTDCPAGKTCACLDAPYAGGSFTCVPGNCRVDADCGAGGYCSPSSTTGICGDSLAGYYCHTARDLCVDDSDCPATPGSPDVPGCVYSAMDSRWECDELPVCL